MATGVVYRPPALGFPHIAVIFVQGEIVSTQRTESLREGEVWLQKALASFDQTEASQGD
jgi:hypothetical protein